MRPCPSLPTPAVATPAGVVFHPTAGAQDVLTAALTWALVRDGIPFVPGEVTLLAGAVLAAAAAVAERTRGSRQTRDGLT